MKKTRGITLVALVVTIVVLLILAGITIVYVFGDNGIFGKATQAKLETELSKIEEQAGVIYLDKILERAKDNNKEKITEKEIINELKKSNKNIEEEYEGIIDIKLDKEKISMGTNASEEIRVELIRGNQVFYYVVIDGKRYRIRINDAEIKVDRTPSSSKSEEDNRIITANSSKKIVTIGEIEGDAVRVASTELIGNDIITISYGDITKQCEVIIKLTVASLSNNIGGKFFYIQERMVKNIYVNAFTHQMLQMVVMQN